MQNVAIIVLLLFGITFLGVLSNRYKFPFPIVLVLFGIAISLIPGLPEIALSPEVVFLIFLPPLLYAAAWNTSWHEFKYSLKPITLAAVGLVLLTTIVVAIGARMLIPDISWPTAFLIGAIVSPPDAVAATSVTKGLGLTPRLITILEGESLVNDASGLIAYKYALAAVAAGNFLFWNAGLNFLVVSAAGIVIGLIVGYALRMIHKKFICDSIIEVTLTLLTPFASYLLAEHFHFSGVLAVVASGLYLSFHSSEIFSHQSRVMAYTVWEVVIFILNGLIFILIGLQLKSVMSGIEGEGYPVEMLMWYGFLISLLVIAVRFVAIVPNLLPKSFARAFSRKKDLSGRHMIVFSWAGMRGVVSMAAALALPLTLDDGAPFPHRNLIIYLTFCVIFSTLVLLGFTLPWVIRKLKLEPHSIVAEEYEVRTEVVKKAISHIEENFSLVQDELLNNIKSKYEVKFNRLQKTDLPANYFGGGKVLPGSIFNEFTQMQIDVIGVERDSLNQLHRSGRASEEIIRKIERELDLEETRLSLEMYQD
jgi:CPA1 family monovalent cation:H+ antiporter